MQIEKIPISEIVPYSKNPRKNDQAVDMVAQSIKEFGFQSPIILGKDNVILAGHTRIKAAQKLGLKEVPVIWAENLTEAKEIAYRIADNKSSELAEWDFELLKSEFQELESLEMDLDTTGFNPQETGDILGGGEIKEDEFTEVDAYERAKSKSTVKLGDIYQLGEHRLMCGDAMMKGDVDKLMDGNKADMMFTDPPYGYSYESNHQNKHKMLANDDKILDFIPVALPSLKENSALYIFCGWQTVKNWIELHENSNLNIKNIIIWKKNNWSMGDLKGAYAGQYEMIIYSHNGRVEIQGERDRDIWEFDRVPPTNHPTTKPMELCSKAIKNHKGDTVLDLFGGSGTTLIACEQLKRKCYMMEIDPVYCSVIIERWEKLTKQKAVKT